MILAIVGSRALEGSESARATIDKVIDEYRPTEIVSGGATGIDTMAKMAADARGIPTKIFLPKVSNWRFGYMPRNLEIARYCDALVRIVAKDNKSYGSGWTRDRAEELGKPTEEFVV